MVRYLLFIGIYLLFIKCKKKECNCTLFHPLIDFYFVGIPLEIDRYIS